MCDMCVMVCVFVYMCMFLMCVCICDILVGRQGDFKLCFCVYMCVCMCTCAQEDKELDIVIRSLFIVRHLSLCEEKAVCCLHPSLNSTGNALKSSGWNYY